MRKIIIVLLIVVLMGACTVINDVDEGKAVAMSGQPKVKESDLSDPATSQELKPIPEPTTVQPIVSVSLPSVVSDNEEFLSRLNIDEDPDFITEMCTPIELLISSEDDAYYVEFNQDRMSNLQLDRPDMPMYTWYINGSNSDKIAEVIIEFDLLETIHSLHPGFFGYDKGYYITLHYDQHIQRSSAYEGSQLMGDIIPVDLPELGEDLRKYAIQEGTHVTIKIPYSEFQGAEKDLTLQFLPGTTFANLSVNLWGADELDETILSEISQEIDKPGHEIWEDVLLELGEPDYALGDSTDLDTVINNVGSFIWGDDGAGLTFNADGSINMPVSFYNLGEYADEVEGKYAVVPEGLVPAFATLSSDAYYGNMGGDKAEMVRIRRNLVDFVFDNLMDETGQFYGVYDISQGITVASERRSPALPILSSMCMSIAGPEGINVLTNQEIAFILDSIIKNDIVRIGDKLYYAPNGVNSEGAMVLKLSDFYISSALIEYIIDFAVDENSLYEEYGIAMLLEGYVNSLKLIVEGQEQNETRLPSSKLTVTFKDGGDNYELLTSDVFDISDSFFATTQLIEPLSSRLPGEGAPLSKLAFVRTNQSVSKKLSTGNSRSFNESQAKYIRECERQYAEIYNIYEIQTTLYECFLYIYNFLQMQTSETAYAPQYNVHTGEMIEASTDMLDDEFYEVMEPIVSRFGTPATLMNYNLLVGIFNDETEIVVTAIGIPYMYERWTGGLVFGSQGKDPSNPDLYAGNGYDIWGYDSLYPMGYCSTAYSSTEPFFDRLGFSFNRENWIEYTMRKLNENTRNEEYYIKLGDELPLFYDHIPMVEIVNSSE